jgi:hypothetical protein
MSDLVELGFQARRNFREDLELQYFKEWCNENRIKIDNTLRAEILWETNLSKLKGRESGIKQLCC